jgi:type IV secretion system protein VirD4
LRSFLIAQSLNQIEKAYGPNNSILDNCHVRIAFATNDERTAKRISDALGTATELRAQRNYAGHRLSPWLGHLMVSRQETARPLLTPGEVMQLPMDEEVVMVAGLAPIRAKKLKYYEDNNFTRRIIPPPPLSAGGYADKPPTRKDYWASLKIPVIAERSAKGDSSPDGSAAEEGALHRHPELTEQTAPIPTQHEELTWLADDESQESDVHELSKPVRDTKQIARLAALDPSDGIPL